jgi:molecular chaperone DnaK (HSP70)
MPSKSFAINYGGSTRLEVTREKFEELTKDKVEETMDFVRQILEVAKISKEDVDVVLLVGGSTLMPMVKSAVEGLFPGKVRVEQPNLAVAKGAALAAAIEWSPTPSPSPDPKEDENKLIIISDKLTRSLGPAVFVEENKYMIDNLLFVGDELKSEATATYGTRIANQPEVRVVVYENVSRDRVNKYVTPPVDENGNEQHTDQALKVNKIDNVVLKLPPNTAQGTPIQVVFRSSAIGLEVSATNLETGESVKAVMTSENTKTAEEVNAEKERFASIKTSGQI